MQDEFKRVKGKVDRFKINRRTANVGAISGSTPLKVSKDKFFLTSSRIPENLVLQRSVKIKRRHSRALDKILAKSLQRECRIRRNKIELELRVEQQKVSR